MTICYTIAVYMVYTFLGEGASETHIGTLTGLLVRCPLNPLISEHNPLPGSCHCSDCMSYTRPRVPFPSCML